MRLLVGCGLAAILGAQIAFWLGRNSGRAECTIPRQDASFFFGASRSSKVTAMPGSEYPIESIILKERIRSLQEGRAKKSKGRPREQVGQRRRVEKVLADLHDRDEGLLIDFGDYASQIGVLIHVGSREDMQSLPGTLEKILEERRRGASWPAHVHISICLAAPSDTDAGLEMAQRYEGSLRALGLKLSSSRECRDACGDPARLPEHLSLALLVASGNHVPPAADLKHLLRGVRLQENMQWVAGSRGWVLKSDGSGYWVKAVQSRAKDALQVDLLDGLWLTDRRALLGACSALQSFEPLLLLSAALQVHRGLPSVLISPGRMDAVADNWASVAAPSLPTRVQSHLNGFRLEAVMVAIGSVGDAKASSALVRALQESSVYRPVVLLLPGAHLTLTDLWSSLDLDMQSCTLLELGEDNPDLQKSWRHLLLTVSPVAVVAVRRPSSVALNLLLQTSRELLMQYPHPLAIACLLLPLDDLAHAAWVSQLHPEALTSWGEPHFSISIITNTRPWSLRRLLRSLEASLLFGYQVGVDFFVESTADDETLELIHRFSREWMESGRGLCSVHFRVIKGGLIRAVAESYYPVDRHHHCFLLEDDIEVSPLFFLWSLQATLTYQYGRQSDFAPDMYGISLYTPRINEIGPRRYVHDMSEVIGTKLLGSSAVQSHSPFLSEIPCSWGALYFPDSWMEYRAYLAARLDEGHVEVIIPHSRSNGWKTSWKKFYIEMAYQRRAYMLYPNYRNQTSFSTNWLEPGEHIVAEKGPRTRGDKKHRPEDFTVPLMRLTDDVLGPLPDGRMPSLSDLPRMDVLERFIDEVDAGLSPSPGDLYKTRSRDGSFIA
jgi:hypothetical protein